LGGLAHPVPYPRLVDWRSRVRKLVNREGYLSSWRLALMRVIDPVEWYMRRAMRTTSARPGDEETARSVGRAMSQSADRQT
jgi:hypothetical protein